MGPETKKITLLILIHFILERLVLEIENAKKHQNTLAYTDAVQQQRVFLQFLHFASEKKYLKNKEFNE